MAYKILKQLIFNGSRSKEAILKMADVYYATGRITEEEYRDIISQNEKKTKEKVPIENTEVGPALP